MIKPYAIALLGLLSSTAVWPNLSIFFITPCGKAAGQNPSLTTQGQLRPTPSPNSSAHGNLITSSVVIISARNPCAASKMTKQK